jgi:hypothetical protein
MPRSLASVKSVSISVTLITLCIFNENFRVEVIHIRLDLFEQLRRLSEMMILFVVTAKKYLLGAQFFQQLYIHSLSV